MSRPKWFSRWLRSWDLARSRHTDVRRSGGFRPFLEALEDRLAPTVTPAHLYTFASSFTDSLGGPAIVPDGGTLSGGRYVFGAGQGLHLTGALATPTNYSVAFVVRLDSLNSLIGPADPFVKLIDFQNQTQDFGLYVASGQLDLYPGPSGADLVSAGQDFQVVLTRDAVSGVTSLYLNGVLERTYFGDVSVSASNLLTFFEDDSASGGVEVSSGSVDYIATYDRALTADEVANLGDPQGSQLPSVSADHPAVSASENQGANNTGVWANAASLSASIGTVVQNGNGTWSWSGTGDENASYTVIITAAGPNNSTATASFNVSFTDVPPTVAADHASVSAAENVAAVNTGTFGDYDDTVTLSASVGTVTQNSNGTWSWSGTGDESSPYNVTITATNADGLTATASFGVSFTDAAPTVAANQVWVSAPENTVAVNTGTFGDFDDAVTLSASAGTVTQNNNGTWSWSGTGDESSSYNVTITATNSHGSTATTSFDVSFTDVAPTVAANNASVSVPEGTTAANTGTFGDYDDAVTLSASIGTVTANNNGTWSWSFAATDELSQTVTITATNSDGMHTSTSFNLAVTNLPPAITALSSSSPTAVQASSNGQVTITGSFSDPGTLDTHTVTVNWGDGTPVQTLTSVDQLHGLFSGAHTYAAGGLYSITVTLADDDGASVTRTTSAYVTGLNLVNGVLYIVGTSGSDSVDINLVRPGGGRAILTISTQFNVGSGHSSSSVLRIDPSLVKKIVIYSGGGRDHIVIHNNVTIPVSIF